MLAALLLFPLAAGPADADVSDAWPAFNGGGRVAEDADPPAEWSGVEPTKNIAWEASIPDGQSSPVVLGDTVYATGVEGPNKEQNVVVAVDLETGEEKWRYVFDNSAPKESSLYVSRAAPTPCADDAGVYAYFESGDLVALTPEGEKRWERSLAFEYGAPQNNFQLGGSPAQLGDKLFVPFTDSGPSYLLCVDKATGDNLWKADLEPSTSYNTPLVVTAGGAPQVVLSYGGGGVVSFDPADGAVNWEFTDLGGNTVSSPVPVPGTDDVLLIGASAGGRREENKADAIRSNLALKIPVGDAVKTGEPEALWRADRVITGFASPLAYDGRTYWIERNGVLNCLSAADGSPLFKARLPQDAWATPLAAGGRLYFFGKDGVTAVLNPADEYDVIAENTLFEKDGDGGGRGGGGFGGDIQYGAAPAGETLVIRVNERLVAVRK